MTKLRNMKLPKNKPMEYCEKCKEWIPDLEKHLKKRHIDGGKRNKTNNWGNKK